MKVECTWGDGPDVLVVLDGKPIMLYEDPSDMDKCTHGLVRQGSLDLTAEEAQELGVDLITAARQARQLSKQYAEHCKEHHKKQIESDVESLDKGKMEWKDVSTTDEPGSPCSTCEGEHHDVVCPLNGTKCGSKSNIEWRNLKPTLNG